MEEKLLRYTLRVDRLNFQKFRYIAESEGRLRKQRAGAVHQKARGGV